MTTIEFLKRYDNHESFDERELKSITWGDLDGYMELITEEKGDNRRWSRTVYQVWRVEDRYFELTYEEGLTEYQENLYDEQPKEVRYWTEIKTITEIHWEYI